jgi:hypothetical protein
MPQRRLKRALPLLLVALVAGAIAAAGAAGSAMVETRELRLELNASFKPLNLPVRSFSPVEFEGIVKVAKPGGGEPAALERVVLDFDRDGRLDAAGLPTCAPEQIAGATVEEARALCKGAIVGSGEVEALVGLASGPVATGSAITLFNGPAEAGHPTVLVHAHFTTPATQTYAFLVPIEKRRGEFRYRVTADFPPLAGGLGAITKIKIKVGRRYSAGGVKRSYVAARCSDHILRSHGAFTFVGGLVIEGVGLEKYCAQR